MMFKLPRELAESLPSLKKVRSRAEARTLARLLAGLLGGTVVFLALTPWQQTARGTGRVIAFNPTDRPQLISAPVEGRLQKWYVHEGSRVAEGDTILELADNDPEILERLKTERKAVNQRLSAARLSVSTSKINVERQRELFEKGISARRAFEQAELEYARYLTDEANSSAELSRIEVRLARQTMQLVKAPRSGTILRRLAGQESVMVKAGDTLAELVPDTASRAVELFVLGNDAPLVHAGSKVRLQFEGWPAVQFSGWPSVAVGTFGGLVTFMDQADDGRGMFRVVIQPEEGQSWPDPIYLRQGVRVNGWVLLSQVTLGFELWRQFNGFPASVDPPRTPAAESKK